MPLTDLIGHGELLKRLQGELQRRPSHAYLFWGPRGVGKELVAEALTLSLLCERYPGRDFCCDLLHCPVRAAPARPARGAAQPRCDCCGACVQVALRVHPDFDYLTRAPNRSFVLIEQVRDLIAHLGGKPVRGGARVAIVDDAELLNLAAQNALLKTLEEPPGHALLFLIAENPSALLDTVRSRLRPVRFAPLPIDALSELLVARCGLQPPSAAALARLARGSAARALAIAGGTAPPIAELIATLKAARTMDFMAVREAAERLFGTREEAAANLELLARLLEDLLANQLLAEPLIDPDPKIAAAMDELARTLSREQILIILDLVLTAASRVDAMANPRLQAEGLWMAAAEALRQNQGAKRSV